jgi:protein-S-isoprenylcysteine O-methyltransferase Ste14
MAGGEKMGRIIAFIFGLGSYGLFFLAFLYLVGFLAGHYVPKGIDDGAPTSTGLALLVNLGLVALFGLQHSIMARPAFKRRITELISPSVERSTFVLATSLVLVLLFWQWRPMGEVIWHVGSGWGAGLLWALFAAGFLIVLASTFIIDHFDLFGLRQVTLNLMGRAYAHPPFRVTWLYRFIRHPLYLGLVIAFFATPHMTAGHLVFAVAMTAYIFIGVRFEERDLATFLGEDYRRYRERVPMLLPSVGRVHETVRPPRAVASRH